MSERLIVRISLSASRLGLRRRQHTSKPIKYLALTHYYAVRVLGACASEAEHIVASEATRKLTDERGKQDWRVNS
jgi:hypothetical protein